MNRTVSVACSCGGGVGGVGWLESVTFFKASVRLKTKAVVPLIIYSQKIPCEEHIFKERLAENKTTTCEYLWQPIIHII